MVLGALTAEELRQLKQEGHTSPLVSRLLDQYVLQQRILETVDQYLTMFSEGDGTPEDVGALVSDLQDTVNSWKMGRAAQSP